MRNGKTTSAQWAALIYAPIDRLPSGTSRRSLLVRTGGDPRAVLVLAVAAGAGLAWYAGRLLNAHLFEVTATDPRVFLAAALLLAGVGVLAAWVPARRAAAVDPVAALRAE